MQAVQEANQSKFPRRSRRLPGWAGTHFAALYLLTSPREHMSSVYVLRFHALADRLRPLGEFVKLRIIRQRREDMLA